MTCLVTGATGFIGRPLCARLREVGVDVIPASRSGAPLANGAPTRVLDLVSPGAALKGVEAVCHLAGIAHRGAAAEDYRQVNVEATLALARAALAAGVRRFVFVSSVKAMGPAIGSAPRDEAAVRPAVDAYGLSKWQAEEGLRALCADSGMALLIVRPCLVYGPAPKGNLRLLARAARWGAPRPPAGGARSMISLEDLNALLVLLLREGPAGEHTWIAGDGQRYTSRDIHDCLRRALGRDVGRSWLPAAGWRLACRTWDGLRGNRGDPTCDKLFASELYDAGAVTRDTGWRPRQTLADVAPAMVRGMVRGVVRAA